MFLNKRCLCYAPRTRMAKKIAFSTVVPLGTILISSFILLKIMYGYYFLTKLTNENFPDTFWHISDSFAPPKQERSLSASVQYLKNTSAIFTICLHNVAKYLPKLRRNVEEIASLFGKYHILLGKLDSSDQTAFIIQNWANHDKNIFVHHFGNLSKRYSTSRTEYIAFCRNQLIGTARDKEWLRDAEFLLVMDANVNANDILTLSNFVSNFQYDLNSWATMTASQTRLYYDLWALRSDTINYDLRLMARKYYHIDIATKIYVTVHTQPIPSDYRLVPVRSAFGGFAIYQTRYLNDCWYVGSDQSNQEICEHIAFNLCVRNNGGTIFINPRFQNSDGLVNEVASLLLASHQWEYEDLFWKSKVLKNGQMCATCQSFWDHQLQTINTYSIFIL